MRSLKDIICEDFKLSSKGKILKEPLKQDIPPRMVNDVIYELGEYLSYLVHDYIWEGTGYNLDDCLRAWAHEKQYRYTEECNSFDDEIKYIIENIINTDLRRRKKEEFDTNVLINSNQWEHIKDEFVRLSKYYL